MGLVQLNTTSRQNVASEVINHQTADVTKKLSNTTPSISAIPCREKTGGGGRKAVILSASKSFRSQASAQYSLLLLFHQGPAGERGPPSIDHPR